MLAHEAGLRSHKRKESLPFLRNRDYTSRLDHPRPAERLPHQNTAAEERRPFWPAWPRPAGGMKSIRSFTSRKLLLNLPPLLGALPHAKLREPQCDLDAWLPDNWKLLHAARAALLSHSAPPGHPSR